MMASVISWEFGVMVYQYGITQPRRPDPDALRTGWRARAARIGEPAGLTAAEAFTVLRLH